MPLTEAQVRTAKPASKAFKLYDSDGLFLFVTPSGGKLWRFEGKEKLLALGAYPKVGLAKARKQRNSAIEEVQAGTDPTEERRQSKAAAVQARRTTLQKRRDRVAHAASARVDARLCQAGDEPA